MSFSPDGNTLVSANSDLDATVKLWSREGSLLKTFRMERGADVRRVRFSPDGRTIALASDDSTVKLWNTEGRESKILKGHNNGVDNVQFSRDGRIIASISTDQTVKLWSRDGRELKTFKGQDGSDIIDVNFSPDGKLLALAQDDGTVILKSIDLDDLLVLGCDWLHNYLKNSPKVSESDRHLCDGIGTQK